MRRLRWTVGIVFVAAAAAVGAWYLWQPAKVSVVTPQRGDAAEIVYASGSVEPQTWA
ncbi:MAG: efflux transporter periplasmic adaptor subunit, partial [Mesorhizobium sp.]